MSVENSTFASRAGIKTDEPREDEATTKAEQGDKAENKAVARKSTRSKKA